MESTQEHTPDLPDSGTDGEFSLAGRWKLTSRMIADRAIDDELKDRIREDFERASSQFWLFWRIVSITGTITVVLSCLLWLIALIAWVLA